MAISFVNIKSGERVTLTRPHQIGAFINSSDIGPNSNKGQDFGWRLSEDTIVKLDELRTDEYKLEDISKRIGVSIDELTTIHLVQHLSYEAERAERTKSLSTEREPAFKKDYEARIESLRSGHQETPEVKPAPKSSKK